MSDPFHRAMADLSILGLNRYARLTGIAYLFIFVCGIFANFFVLEALVVPGDATTTAQNISASQSLFRIGVLSFIIMVIFDVVVSWGLYVLFKPVRMNVSVFMAWLRLINSAIFGIALFNLFTVLQLINNPGTFSALDPSQLNSQIMLSLGAFDTTWMIGLIFFGLHLLVLGYLILNSSYMPKLIGILLIAAGIGYLIDSAALTLMSDYESYAEIFSSIVILLGVIGELSLTLWLLIKGVGKPSRASS